MARPTLIAVAALVGLLVGCAPEAEQPPDAEPPPEQPDDEPDAEADDEPAEPVVETVAEGLEVPWGIDFAPDGHAYLTERDSGWLSRLDPGTGEVERLRRLEVHPAGEGGLLGVAVPPDHDETGEVLVYKTTRTDNRVVRLDPAGDGPTEPVVTGIPAGRVHNGGRIRVADDGALWITTGDAGEPARSDDPADPAGAVLRTTVDGDPPDDAVTDGSIVHAHGLRNAQGVGFDADGRAWVADFGPDVDDEVYRLEPGAHHGWPHVTGVVGDDRYVDPAVVRQPPEASWSGLEVVGPDGPAGWEGDVLVAALRGERLWRFTVDDGEEVDAEQLLVGEHGRLREVREGPDGALWLLTSNRDGRGSPRDGDDRVLRLGPPR